MTASDMFLALTLTLSITIGGCAANAGSEGDAESTDALTGPTLTVASVSEVDVGAEDRFCESTGSYAEVKLADVKVAATINPTLVRSLDKLTDFRDCGLETERLRVKLRMVPTYNKGILSILETQISPDTYPIAKGHNFDLTTGKSLGLEDVLTPLGIDNLKAECIKQVASGSLEGANAKNPELVCKMGMNPKDSPVDEGGFIIQNDGIHLQMNLWPLPPDRSPRRNNISLGWSKLGGARALKHPALVTVYRGD